ncbi:nucleotide-binding protein [Pseudonocardia phyllosphaerae]|uniref:nucleotide-binding protein n=1 Tax=Pseudonocardia phyllosphaerae TaxID=3390502 RepID=UPI003978F2BC
MSDNGTGEQPDGSVGRYVRERWGAADASGRSSGRRRRGQDTDGPAASTASTGSGATPEGSGTRPPSAAERAAAAPAPGRAGIGTATPPSGSAWGDEWGSEVPEVDDELVDEIDPCTPPRGIDLSAVQQSPDAAATDPAGSGQSHDQGREQSREHGPGHENGSRRENGAGRENSAGRENGAGHENGPGARVAEPPAPRAAGPGEKPSRAGTGDVGPDDTGLYHPGGSAEPWWNTSVPDDDTGVLWRRPEAGPAPEDAPAWAGPPRNGRPRAQNGAPQQDTPSDSHTPADGHTPEQGGPVNGAVPQDTSGHGPAPYDPAPYDPARDDSSRQDSAGHDQALGAGGVSAGAATTLGAAAGGGAVAAGAAARGTGDPAGPDAPAPEAADQAPEQSPRTRRSGWNTDGTPRTPPAPRPRRTTPPEAPEPRSAQHRRGDDPHAHGLDLARSRHPHNARRVPQSGWRRFVYVLTRGLWNPGESPAELHLRELETRVKRPLPTSYKIAMLSLKGGVGKTTVTATLGATFAAHRGDRVVAVDANPDRGTLSQKIPLETTATVRHLLRDAPQVRRYTDVRAYTSQGASRLEVLASEQDPAVSEAFSEEDYRQALDLLEHFYSLVLTDCGTGLMHSAMYGVLGLADQIVIVSSGSIDGARSASATLDWLDAHGYTALVRNAVVVINSVFRRAGGGVDLDRVAEHFAGRCRAVVRVPFDPHLEEGAEIDLDSLEEPTRAALLELAASVADGFPV